MPLVFSYTSEKSLCGTDGQCYHAPSCVDELRTMLASIFLVQLVIGNFNELLLPQLRCTFFQTHVILLALILTV